MNLPAVLEQLQSPNAVVLVAALTVAAALCAKLCARGLRRSDLNAHRRGALLSDGRSMQRRSARRKKLSSDCVTLAGIAIPPADETKHFKLIGTTGTGKSTAIRELLGCAIARGDRAVFADPDAGYVEH